MSAYPNFGKVKEVVLPFSKNEMPATIDEYKEIYGIDLREFLYLENGYIKLKAKNTVFYIETKTPMGLLVFDCFDSLIPVTNFDYQQHSSSSMGYLKIGSVVNGNVSGLGFAIEPTKEFKIENIIVLYFGN